MFLVVHFLCNFGRQNRWTDGILVETFSFFFRILMKTFSFFLRWNLDGNSPKTRRLPSTKHGWAWNQGILSTMDNHLRCYMHLWCHFSPNIYAHRISSFGHKWVWLINISLKPIQTISHVKNLRAEVAPQEKTILLMPWNSDNKPDHSEEDEELGLEYSSRWISMRNLWCHWVHWVFEWRRSCCLWLYTLPP